MEGAGGENAGDRGVVDADGEGAGGTDSTREVMNRLWCRDGRRRDGRRTQRDTGKVVPESCAVAHLSCQVLLSSRSAAALVWNTSPGA